MRPDVCRVETSGIILERVEKFDWFFFREDDIVLYDAFVLGKLEKFNRQSGYEKAILSQTVLKCIKEPRDILI
jgi:hypothetical protein